MFMPSSDRGSIPSTSCWCSNLSLRRAKWVLLIAAALLPQSAAFAQTAEPSPTSSLDQGAIRKRLQQQIQQNQPAKAGGEKPEAPSQPASQAQDEAKGTSFVPEAPSGLLNDKATQDAYLAAMREYYNYRISGFRHRQRVFDWQFLSSKLIFATVLILVLAGIYFAAIQFHKGLAAPKNGGAEKEEATDIEATLKGIKVRSPVLGVVILVISFAFFYLYLVYVYPIHEVF